ncbi:glycosyltransferase [candidate division KSB1 bacterium]|nr:glycosyltransferase [candidate division KSB1 bacterium]
MILIFMFSLVILYALFIGMFISGFQKNSFELSLSIPFITIIVAVRNGGEWIEKCVNALLAQTYPVDKREIIIIDDGSSDSTLALLKTYSSLTRPDHITITTRPPSSGNKKLALELGINQARGDILLFTDADCVPPPSWAETIVSCFSKTTGMVVGFSPLIHKYNSFIGHLIKIDSLFATLFAGAGIGLNIPLTAAGRNIAWRRSLFSQVEGYKSISKSLSGDDDLFMQLVHKQTNLKIRYSRIPKSVVPSYHRMSLQDFLHQKSRHISAAKFYPRSRQIIYGVFHLLNFGLHGLAIAALVLGKDTAPIFTLLALTHMIDWLFLRIGVKKFNMSFKSIHFLGWEWLFLFYNVISGIKGIFRPVRWQRH